MKSKRIACALLKKMPDDVTLAEIISWVDIEDLIGATQAAAFSAELEQDLAAFFSKKKRDAHGSRETKHDSAKKKVLHLLSRLPDDVGLGEILNRLVLLRKIEAGLKESERGEGMDHDAFFKQLVEENENDEDLVAAPRPPRPPRTKKTNRGKRPPDRRQVRPAS